MNGMRLPDDWFPRPLPANVSIGDRSWLYSSFSFLHCESESHAAVRIGSDSGVYFTSFFELGAHGSVSIGDHCAVVGATIACDCRVVIEDYAFIAHDVVIADTPFAVPPASRSRIAPSASIGAAEAVIRIGRNAWIGARSTILLGADIGDDAIIGAGTLVDFPVPPSSIVAGAPARIVERVPHGDS